MRDDLAAYHRLVSVTYHRYLEADRSLAEALDAMRQVFPADVMPYRGTLGAPRSRIRRLRDERDRALGRLETSLAQLRAARSRRPPRAEAETPLRLLTVIAY
ncbi:MAG: hypothetical protein Kow0013_00250 [Pararhodobacter sp.]